MSSPSRSKRRKVDGTPNPSSLASFDRTISPPPLDDDYNPTDPATFDDKNDKLRDFLRPQPGGEKSAPKEVIDLTVDEPDARDANGAGFLTAESSTQTVSSPFRLTRIRGLPNSENKNTVGIDDILGDVMLREVWLFNYMHDIEWMMEQLDEDIVGHVKVVFVHGNWKLDDPGRHRMEEQVKAFPNARLVAAYMPEPFGTHHSKIMVLFRGDDTAQVIVYTANMISFDWENMTQAAWISPLLPLGESKPPSPIGDAFKTDALDYFSAYGKARTGVLVEQLKKYSFSAVKAIFVGSVPGRHKTYEAKWGWPKLRKVLSTIPSTSDADKTSTIFAQCSSIATLGVKDTWLTPVLFKAMSASANVDTHQPDYGIIFPTAQEIRDSLNGYGSGSSIHLRLGSPAQAKQLSYLTPLLHHWSSPPLPGTSASPSTLAGRDLAAPHIKTYIRYANTPQPATTIDWALLSSANLSTQAWGAAEKDGMVRICSYEAGVLVHPGLWGEGFTMVPAFREDTVKRVGWKGKVVALRMPYGLPVQKYTEKDQPWSPGLPYKEPDWMGRRWGGEWGGE
ncbi:tyrosyl-DNA phosphodiesterase-domain-containing protein [Tricharina praecox]|uniref:tyrosyl-DNA phosphodiesterase-domain-containing protein n=1 Tax=Tricharina praecox TaxID=43433 RepID=UPI002220F0A7|nr:tyrosyl-DNA phosphodiesterase-domain-containing protein [Tricharina praecox]KAI5841640.1 tyrosyl-DNA phosphodiesterase-domain-containing protein [Tricharina praecox]